jgi:hypothetical protein
LPAVEKLKTARKIRWSIDIDPVDLYWQLNING